MRAYQALYWRPVERRAAAPASAQREVLRTLLSNNRDTRFGREHGFADIRDPAQFRERVPIQDYEQLRPYVDEQRRTGAPALTKETPLFYAQTSGSTGAPKYIPITPTMLTYHKQEQALFSYLCTYRACPRHSTARRGASGASVEGHLDTGQVSRLRARVACTVAPRVIQSRFVVPPEVAGIADYDLKYLVILRLR